MAVNGFLEDDDDEFFAEVFRSISDLESSSLKHTALETSTYNSTQDGNNLQINTTSSSVNFKAQTLDKADSHLKTDNTNEKTDQTVISNCKRTDNTDESRCENVIQCLINTDLDESEKHSVVNYRFTPGFTPKPKKRKFPGPAGVFIDEQPTELPRYDIAPISTKLSADGTNCQNITSSQFSAEELLQSVSWQKLQEDVSSNPRLLSTVKNFSICRVLSDTLRKKLPKHIIVPALCVYIKKFNPEEAISVYMDDTGEINGRIDKQVLELYDDYIKSGTALVLRRVTFVCNVMLLEKSNLVSMYLNDGSVQHMQEWDAIVEKEEPLKPLNCVCPFTPKLSERRNMTLKNLNNTPVLKRAQNMITKNVSEVLHSGHNSPHSAWLEDGNANSHHKLSIDSTSTDPDLENCAMDEFDELLGNLDEKSFLEDF